MTRTLIGPEAVPFMFLFLSATAIAADAESGPETSITVTGYYYAMRDQSDYGVGVTSLNRGALHLEARYNYEANRSASLFAGWNFAGGESVTFQVTPLIGGLFGETHGVVPGIQTRSLAMSKFWAEHGMRFIGTAAEHALLLEKSKETVAALRAVGIAQKA